MQMSPTTPPSRRSRAKTADDSATATPRKTRTTRKTPPKPLPQPAETASVDVVALHPDPAELTSMIATAAYFLAAERNFAPGGELDDWLEAERRVHDLHR